MSKLIHIDPDYPTVVSHEVVDISCPPTTVEHYTDRNIVISHEFQCFPMSCYDKKIKDNQEHIYYMDKKKTKYVKVSPQFNNRINGEFDERVFYATMVIGHRQKYLLNLPILPNSIITYISEIVKVMGLKYNGKYRKLITESLQRLSATQYEFKNCYYNSNNSKTVESLNFSIISSFKYISHIEVEILNPLMASLFTNKKVKDFLIININDNVMTNFINKKGYLLYNADQLLSIDSGITRKIFMYCDRKRWRTNGESDLNFSVQISILSQIVPIMTKNYSRVASIIKKSLEVLKNGNYIVDYVFHQEAPIKNSWIEVFFATSRKYTNSLVDNKQLDDKPQINDDILIHSHEVREIIDIKDVKKKEKNYNKNVIIGLDENITELFQDLILQNSTIQLINALYHQYGVLHIKALIKDAVEKATNHDSYIFTMLSNNVEPKWYVSNQAKYIQSLIKENEIIKIENELQNEQINLKNEFEQYCNDNNNIEYLQDLLKKTIEVKIEYLTLNPKKLVVQHIGMEQYVKNLNRDLSKFLANKYLFFAWIKFNNKSVITVQDNKLFVEINANLF